MHLPPSEESIFWSVVVCDATNRSGSSRREFSLCAWNSTPNADGSVDVYFGPTAPAGLERNWIRTVQGKPWFPRLRFYSPLESADEQSWTPGDIVEVG